MKSMCQHSKSLMQTSDERLLHLLESKKKHPTSIQKVIPFTAAIRGIRLLALIVAVGFCSPNNIKATILSVTNGLALRLDATIGVTVDTNGLVSYWSDQSTNGNDAFQAGQLRQPLLVTNGTISGAPVIRFDGLNTMLTLTGQVITSQDFTIFAVVNATPSNGGNHEIFGNWSWANLTTSVYVGITGYSPESDSASVRFTDGDPNAGTAIAVSGDSILDFITQQSNNISSVAQDGITLFSGVALPTRVLTSDPNTSPYTIGVQGDPDHGGTAGEFWAGDIAALLVYNRALTSAEQTQVRQYLQDTFLEPVAPKLIAIAPLTNSVVTTFNSVTVTFSEPVTNVDVSDLLINGTPIATDLTVVSSREYIFQFPQPASGNITVGFAANSAITDLASSPNGFAEANWNYTLVSTNPPTLTAIEPAAGAMVRTLTSIFVIFDKPVTNIHAVDLLVNGSAIATNVTASSPTEYTFFFPQPAYGAVNISILPNSGISDFANPPNAFGGISCNYTLNANAPISLIVQSGLALRLEATTGVTADANGLVSLWSDQTTNGNDAVQSNFDWQPQLVPNVTASGAPVIRFDGESTMLTLTGQIITSQDFTIFAVVNATPSDTGNHEIFGNWSWVNLFTSVYVGITGYDSGSDSATVRFTDGDSSAGTATGISQDFILDFINQQNPSLSSVSQDGTNLFTGPALTTRNLSSNSTNSPYTIGSQGDPAHGGSYGEVWPGDIAALLVYNRALTSTEQSQVRQYLNATYLAPPSPPNLSIQLVSGNTISVSWPQTGNMSYILQSTTTLSEGSWTDLGSGTLIDGQYEFNEPFSPSAGHKFYRLRTETN